MTTFQIIAILTTLAALFSYIVQLPLHQAAHDIEVMLMALIASLGLIGLAALGFAGIRETATRVVESSDFIGLEVLLLMFTGK
jgi:hypothetical protein